MKRLYDKATDQWFEVSEEAYAEYDRERRKHRQNMYNHGRCGCPKGMWWSCDMTCMDCEYRKENMLSLDVPTEDGDETLMDILKDSSPLIEDVMADRDLLDFLIDQFRELEPEADRILALYKKEDQISDRAIAKALGRPQRTFSRQMKRYRAVLQDQIDLADSEKCVD